MLVLSVLYVPLAAGGIGVAAEPRVDAAGDRLPPEIRMRLGSTRLWHRNLVGLQFSSDGKQLLSKGDDALSWGAKPRVKWRVWDVATGKLLKTLPGSAYVNKSRPPYYPGLVTPDGKSRLQLAWDDLVCRDKVTKKTRWQINVAPNIPGPGLKDAAVNRVAFSPDGRTLAVGSNCGRIVLLDWRTGKYVKGSSRQVGLYKEWMYGAVLEGESVSFSPDSSRLIVADAMIDDEEQVLCDANTGKELRRIKNALVLAWSPDGKRLAQTSWSTGQEFLHLTEAATGKELWKIKASPDEVIFSRDGKTITYRENDGNTFVLDAQTGKSLRAFRLPASMAKDASPDAISPDGTRVAVSTVKGREIQVCRIDGRTVWSRKIPKDWKSWSVQFAGNQRLAIQVRVRKVDSFIVQILDATTGRQQCEILTGERRYRAILAVAPDGRAIAVKGLEEKREIRNTTTGRVVHTFEPRLARHQELQFSPDGKWCAFNIDDHTIEVRDSATGKLVNRFHRPEHFLRDITFTPNSRTIALTFNDCTVWLWDAVQQQPKPAR